MMQYACAGNIFIHITILKTHLGTHRYITNFIVGKDLFKGAFTCLFIYLVVLGVVQRALCM